MPPDVQVFSDPETLARQAARVAAASLTRLLSGHEFIRLLAATGASQLAFLEQLVTTPSLTENQLWKRVELFHLDEYIGLGEEHGASFARYIRERLIVPAGIERHHLLDGTVDPTRVVASVSEEIRRAPIHLAFAGIGENGHLAFNDPPADFASKEAYAIVELDEACRRQQLNEGWFASLDEVPRTAISITIPQLLATQEILCVVPDRRKAEAVKAALHGPLTPDVPASALQLHPNVHIFLDSGSASLL